MSDDDYNHGDDWGFDHSPRDLTLEQRMSQAGLLPGDTAWGDDLMSQEYFVKEWIGHILLQNGADEVVHEAGMAQIRRLLPDMDDVDRTYLSLGLIVGQAWLYTFMLGRANARHAGGIPVDDEAALRYMEYKITSLVTMLDSMGDDTDMSIFEEQL